MTGETGPGDAQLLRLLRSIWGGAASGVLLAAALPPALPPAVAALVGFVALVPVLVAVEGAGLLFGLAGGLVAAVSGALVAESGLFAPLVVAGGEAAPTFAAFVVFGCVIGAVTMLRGAVRGVSPRVVAALAAAAVLAEAVTLLVLPALLALTGSREPLLLGAASLGGIWLASALVWTGNLAIAGTLRARRFGAAAGVAGVVAAAVFGARLADGGSLAIPSAHAAERGDEHDGREVATALTVAAVQTSRTNLERLCEMNAEAGARGATLVVWPELSVNTCVRRGDASKLIDLAKQAGQPAFASSFQDGAAPLPRNVASVFSRSGETVRYAKRKLFGSEPQIHQSGSVPVAVPVDGRVAGLAICFDSCFPSVLREVADLPGVGYILLPTLDPDSRSGTIQAVHAAFTPFRAAELGLPIVRADSTAASMIVDGRGRVVAEAGIGTRETIVASIVPGRRWTLASQIGDGFLLVCGAVLVWAVVTRRRESSEPGAVSVRS